MSTTAPTRVRFTSARTVADQSPAARGCALPDMAVNATVHPLRHLLVAVDSAGDSHVVLCYALQLAARVHARVTVLMLLPQPKAASAAGSISPIEPESAALECAQRLNADFAAAAARSGVALHTLIRFTTCFERSLRDIAGASDADLIVMSAGAFAGIAAVPAENQAMRGPPLLVIPNWIASSAAPRAE